MVRGRPRTFFLSFYYKGPPPGAQGARVHKKLPRVKGMLIARRGGGGILVLSESERKDHMRIQAYITHEKGGLTLESAELADPRGSEVLVKITASGVCHTDTAGIEQLIPVTLPAVFGHEGVGVVEKTGPAVKSLRAGDHVIMTYPSCGVCPDCLRGRPYACHEKNRLFFDGAYMDGTKRISWNGQPVSSFFGQGAFASHVVVEERNAVRIDPTVDLKPLCSLGCGVQTGAGTVLNRLRPEPGSSIAVFGCGAVGMSAIMAAKIAGCSRIIGVDVVPSRLELARELGATDTVNGREGRAPDQIRALTGEGANYSVECSGIPDLIVQALDCLAICGVCAVVSVTGEREITFKPEPLLMNPNKTLTGLVEGGSNPRIFIPELIEFIKQGKLPVEKLVTYYDFPDIDRAFADSHSGRSIKPILVL